MKKYNVAVVGATGMVGRTFLKVLEERKFPYEKISFLASKRSKGDEIVFDGKTHIVEELRPEAFDGMEIALFSAGGDVSKEYAPIAAAKGVLVIDNSSAWRMDPNVPLVVPEVNPKEIDGHKGIISNPNCSTIQAMPPLKVLDQLFSLEQVIYSTYQSVSGSGVRGMEDLEKGLEGREPSLYAHPIAFNCIPQIDVFLENGYTKEEWKMIEETRKILGREELLVTATCVRVPVRYAHAVSLYARCKEDVDVTRLKEALSSFEGIVVVDEPSTNTYPLQLDAEGKDEVFVGRIRQDNDDRKAVNMWIVADNIRKGAATNAVQIALEYVRRQQDGI